MGAGESAAISLAVEIGAEFILLDDRAAVQAARVHGLTVAGTLAVLIRASKQNLIDLSETIAKLRLTSFFVSDEILERTLRENL